MIIISFSDLDLAKTRVADRPDPKIEVALSFSVLAAHTPLPGELRRWRRYALRRLGDLLPDLGGFTRSQAAGPGLVTRICAALADAGTDGRGRGDAAPPPASYPVPEPSGLGPMLRLYQGRTIAPFWSQIVGRIDQDLQVRARTMLHEGCEHLLRGLGPHTRWQPPDLRVAGPGGRRLQLGGRGLLLIPSFFCWPAPVVVRTAGPSPALAFPVSREGSPARMPADQAGATEESLVALLGRTRALILEASRDGCNTSTLSGRAGVSLSTASEHATVLRDAGLIVSIRHRNEVVHNITPLGTALLSGGFG